MDCRSFRRKHLAYLDDTLSGVETREMREHLNTCGECSRQDASVRRALLVVRNLPAITPSPDFGRRLKVRLAAEGSAMSSWNTPAFRGPSVGLLMSVAASVIVVGALMTLVVPGSDGGGSQIPTLPAVVAETPAPSALSAQEEAAPAIVASMSTGMPMWSALLLAEESSVRLARTAFEPVSLTTDDTQR